MRRFLPLQAFAAGTVICAGSLAATVNVVDPVTGALVKVRQGDSVGGGTLVTLEAAQAEFEAFQIVISGAASHVGVRLTPLVSGMHSINPTGACDGTGHAAAGKIRVYREHFMPIATTPGPQPDGGPPPLSDHNGIGGQVPDALIPQVDEFVNECRWPPDGLTNSGGNLVLWVEIFVPAGTAPGKYAGKVLLSWTSATTCDSAAAISVSLKVWDFSLPNGLNTHSSLRSYFSASMSPGLVDQFGTNGILSNDARTDLVTKIAVMSLDHRISMTNYDDGQSNNLVHYDQAFDLLNSGASQLTRISGMTPTSVNFMGNQSTRDDYDAWHTRFGDRPWWQNVLTYTVDEPGNPNNINKLGGRWCDIHPRGSAAHSNTGAYVIPALVTKDIGDLTAQHLNPEVFPSCANDWGTGPFPFSIDPNTVYPAQDTADVNIMAPIIDALEETTDGGVKTRPQYDNFVLDRSGPLHDKSINAVWTYESCNTHGCADFDPDPAPAGTNTVVTNPKWPSIGAIDHSAIRARAMPWLAFENDASGIFYYDMIQMFSTGFLGSIQGGDPWHNQYVFGGNGDGTLLYPGKPCAVAGCDPFFGGTTNIPVASLRLKMIREGMEDYEYLNLLSRFGDMEKNWAKSQVLTIFPHAFETDWSNATTNAVATLFQVRHMLACRILADLSKSDTACGGPPPPTCPSATPDACNNTCTNFASDNFNCGGCGAGFQCSRLQVCSSGACVCSRAPAKCGPNEIWDDSSCACTE